MVATEEAYVSALTPVVGTGAIGFTPTISFVNSGVLLDVTATVNSYTRYFTAILGRNSPRDVQVLSFYWSDPAEPKR